MNYKKICILKNNLSQQNFLIIVLDTENYKNL